MSQLGDYLAASRNLRARIAETTAMSERHTDVEDLTDENVEEYLLQLVPTMPEPSSLEDDRQVLREIVSLLDRTGVDWPHIILGLEPTP